jgi:hypothetical protein
VHNSLISVGKLCDSGCDIIFTQYKVEVIKNGESVMSGLRDQKLQLLQVAYKKPHNQITKMHVAMRMKQVI